MANAITAAEKYAAVLDRIYKAGSKFAGLDVAPEAIRPTDVAGTFYIQKLALVGMGDYSKTNGFPGGKITLTWEPFTYSQDRGRAFELDAVDETEAMGVFGSVASEFIRVHEVPEIDAYRAAVLATNAGTTVAADISTAAEAVAALNAALTTLQENEVDEDNLMLYITPTLASLVRNRARDEVNTDIFERATVVEVPQSRFYTAIDLDAGASETTGGYSKAAGAEDINFILMDKGAAFADAKHQKVRVFDADTNQDADAWLYQFRIVHDCFVYENREIGVYVHTKAATS